MIKSRLFPTLLALMVCSIISSSCDHRELMDPDGNIHYVRVYMDEQIKNVTYGFYNESYEHPEFNRPLNVHAALASASTGEVVYEGLLRNQGNDERGYYIDGYVKAQPGEYHLLMYQLGSSVTHIRNSNNYYESQAYTSAVSERILGQLTETSKVVDTERIVEEPEHILASRCENITIVPSYQVDTLKTSAGDYFSAKSIAKSYYLQMRITGTQWINSAAAVLSGMAGSTSLSKEEGMVVADSVNLFFSLKHTGEKRRTGNDDTMSTLYATFTTFGKIPDITSVLTLNFEFTKTDGSTQIEKIDLTEAFYTPMALENQWILLDKEINITKPIGGTGGMDPGVEGWKDVNAEIYM